ncbi:metalloendopeptidase [Marinilabiliaceae bacterium JC017]|nr:metalloendopeptidase [Marinilabiliaceae bacterium JC017]
MKKKATIITIVAVAALLIPSLWFIFNRPGYRQYPVPPETIDSMDVVNIPEPDLLFGLPVDSFNLDQQKIKHNQFLSDIFLKCDIDYPSIHKIVEKINPVFDVRKIKVGNTYTLFFSNDTTKQLNYFVYEIDNTDYFVVDLRDSINVYRGVKEIHNVEKTATGIITSSLWNAMRDNGVNPLLAIELSEVYAWTVDFFGIEKGDYFKVIYDEQFVDSTSIGVSKIHAALFHHRGNDYYAFNFEEDSTWNFFDQEGQSLRKAFLKAPLKFSRISSGFSNSRLHPILKIRRPHHGIDYAAPAGTHVHALGDGRVIAKAWDKKGGGNYIKIKHNSVYTTLYMHLKGFAKGISKGDHVKQGQLIGYVGSTGLATGPHLDFRVFKNGRAVNPLKIDAPPVEPVKKEDLEAYKAFIQPLQSKLNALSME